VRNLQKLIEKITRKVAHALVLEAERHTKKGSGIEEPTKRGRKKKSDTESKENMANDAEKLETVKLEKDKNGTVVITPSSLAQFLGKPTFTSERSSPFGSAAKPVVALTRVRAPDIMTSCLLASSWVLPGHPWADPRRTLRQ